MTESQDRKRRFPRVSSQNTVLVRRLRGESAEEFARTRTVGLGGCSFISDEPLGESTELELLISVGHKVLQVRARVAYELSAEGGRFEIGAEFTDMASEDREVLNSLLERVASNPAE